MRYFGTCTAQLLSLRIILLPVSAWSFLNTQQSFSSGIVWYGRLLQDIQSNN